MGKVKRQRTSTTRKDPLLPTTNDDAREATRCGACSRLILVLLPVLGCAFILGSLALLVYRLGVPITDASISTCLETYSPKVEVLVVIFIGATLMFVVTKMRNIQINVYHRRQRSESKCMTTMNLIAAICNVLAYTGFVLLALFDITGPGNSSLIHYIGTFVYFICSAVYGLLHAFLLWKQVQYPIACKVIFTIIPIATVACSAVYAVNQAERYAFEWYAVTLAAVNVGLISILFVVDPVDDELRDFFCCRRVGRVGTGESSRDSSPSKPPRLA